MSQHLLCKSHICLIASYYQNVPGRLMLVLGWVLISKQRRGGLFLFSLKAPQCLQLVAGAGGARPSQRSFGEGGWGGMIGGQLELWPACLGLCGNSASIHHGKEKEGMTRLFRQMLHTWGTAWCLLPAGKSPTGLSFLSGTSRHEHG